MKNKITRFQKKGTNTKDGQGKSNVEISQAPEKENQSKGTEQILRTIIHERFPKTEVQTAC